MQKVVIDTNVYISSLISSTGAPAKVMELVRNREIELLVSYPILKEYTSTALYPAIHKYHRLSKHQIEVSVFDLVKVGKLINPEIILNVVFNDPSDDKFLECAVEGEADFIISGDKHLRDLKNYQGIKVVSPTAFLTLYSKNNPQ